MKAAEQRAGMSKQERRFREYVGGGVEAFYAKATWTDALAVLAAYDAFLTREREARRLAYEACARLVEGSADFQDGDVAQLKIKTPMTKALAAAIRASAKEEGNE